MFKLVIQDDEGKTTVVPLIRDEITIGRKEGNTIRLTERNVSRRHARIVRNNGEVQIEDLGSYNGIRVNNARIAERVSLRVSDQVQIGDYKLYLKAEGVEQVDDARTMPIERVLEQAPPTESMPAIAQPAPTAPVPIQAPPPGLTATGTNPPAAPQQGPTPAAPLVGNMQRTLVAMDGSALQNLASARPIADAALVAKLNETASYGRLVVVSANFAGKEFELSRPQMIIGRTDENDIVVNHRSISRNHAKVTREPETGKYTISDLQSSNGVRVNGNDYTKVELRRGDTVDLGHVRLRFVEPGEDFLFSRDAQLSDVPEAGGKRGLMVAVVFGVIVLAAAGAFFAFRDGGGTSNNGSGGGSNMVDPGSQGVVTTPDAKLAGSDVVADVLDAQSSVVATPIDAQLATVGSNGSNTTTALHPDAGGTTSAETGAEIEKRCNNLAVNSDWAPLAACGNDLKPYNLTKANDLITTAKLEMGAKIARAKLDDSLGRGDFDGAHRFLEQISSNSIGRKDAETAYGNARDKAVKTAQNKVNDYVHSKDCTGLDKYRNGMSHEVARSVTVGECVAATNGSGATSNPCEDTVVDAHRVAGEAALGNGKYDIGLTELEAVLKCRPGDFGILKHTYFAACKAHSFPRAKALYGRFSASDAATLTMKQVCLNVGFDPSL